MSISCFLTYWGEAQDAHAVFEAYRAGPAAFLAFLPPGVPLVVPEQGLGVGRDVAKMVPRNPRRDLGL